MNLYDIGTEWLRLQELLENSEGEITPEAEALLSLIDLTEPAKIDAYVRVMRNLKAGADARDEEIKKLGKASQVRKRAVERMKLCLLEHLRRTDRKKIETPTFTVWRQKNGRPSFSAANLDEVPPELLKVVTELNDEALLAAWKEHQMPPSVEAKVGEHIQIR